MRLVTTTVLKVAAALGIVLGAAVGAVMMYAAWQHNPQGAFHDDEAGVHWAYWFGLGALWFVAAGGATFVAVVVVGVLGRALGSATTR